MRLTVRIVAVTAAAIIVGGSIAAWAATDTGPRARPASEHAAAIAQRSRAPVVRPRPRPPAGPVIEVTGAPQGVKAKGAVLADALTGQVLWSRSLDTERPMASVTKVMTALLVLESANMDQ